MGKTWEDVLKEHSRNNVKKSSPLIKQKPSPKKKEKSQKIIDIKLPKALMKHVDNAFINNKDSYIDIEDLKQLFVKDYTDQDNENEEFKVDSQYMYNPAKYLTGMSEVGDVE